MAESIDKERAIRGIVSSAVKSYANGFSTRHLAEVDDENGVINMKIHNVFIAALGVGNTVLFSTCTISG